MHTRAITAAGLGTTVLAGLTVLAPPNAVGAATWSTPATLMTTVGKPAATSVAGLSNGAAAAVWTYRDAGADEDRLERRYKPSGGSWSASCEGPCVTTPEEQHTPLGYDKKEPRVAAGGGGTHAAAYVKVNDDGTSVVHLDGGSGFGPVSPAYPPGDTPTDLALAVGPSGQDVLAYEAQGPDGPVVEVVGCCSHTFAVAGTTSISSIRAVVDADGRAFVAWQNSIGSNHTLYVATRPANGGWSAPLALDGPLLNAGPVAIASGTGGTSVGWVTSAGVRVRTWSAGTWSEADGPADTSGSLELGALPDGSTLALLDHGDDGKIYQRAAGQTFWSNIRNLASNHNVESHLAVGPDGTATVMYALGSTLVADVRAPDGTWQTTGISDGDSTPQHATLAAGSDGAYALWSQWDGAHYRVFASHLASASGPAGPPPVATVSRPNVTYQTGSTIAVTWSSTGAEPVASVAVRRAVATPRSSGFGSPSVLWASVPAAGTKSFSAAPGQTSCISARAVDTAGQVGGWSAARCTTTPLDDRSLAASKFARLGQGTAYRGTVSKATKKGATLTYTGARARRIALLVTRAPGQGKVVVFLGSRNLGTYSLAGPNRAKHLISVRSFSSTLTGTLRIKVVTKNKVVRIDGVFLGR